MRIIVNDSSALIDLKKGKLLEAFLDLPFELIVPDEILADELLSFTKADIALMKRKMRVATLDGREEEDATVLQRMIPALTFNDCSAFIIAQREAGCILLTGDRRLREKAENSGIECHGVLWIVEQIAKAKLATSSTLLRVLETWRADTYVRLPRSDLEKMIRKFNR